jgi:5-methylcytosine-specific restriction endonuclease McrA
MIDELTNEERWSWIGLLLLAGDNPKEGEISLGRNMGYTDEQICKLIDVPIDVFARAKAKMIVPAQNQDKPKILVDKRNVIQIVNWKKYQSEYERQKPHREPDFIRLRGQIKERDGYICLECNKHEDDLNVPLCIHHIDNDPSNNIPENLITLCMTCHSALLKKTVHKTKAKEIKKQERRFKRKVQEQGARRKFNREGEGEGEGEIDREKDPTLPPIDASAKKPPRVADDKFVFPEPVAKELKEHWQFYQGTLNFNASAWGTRALKIGAPAAEVAHVLRRMAIASVADKIKNPWPWASKTLAELTKNADLEERLKEHEDLKHKDFVTAGEVLASIKAKEA